MKQAVDRWALGSAAAMAAVVAADVATGERIALIPLLLVGPLVAAIGAGPVRTSAIALLATLVALPLGAVDGVYGAGEHVVHLAVVAVGGLLAAVVAGVRQRLEERGRAARRELRTERAARVRSEYLARVGSLLEAPPDPAAMIAEISRLGVPEMADLCVVDLLEDGQLVRPAAHAADPALAEAVLRMRADHPIRPGSRHPVALVAATGTPRLVRDLAPGRHDGYTESSEQARRLDALDYRSAIVAPLRARGRLFGVLSLIRTGADAVQYEADDLEVALEVARRAALALDSARLFAELADTEGRLDAILTSLAEAVTVQRPDGTLVFANEAAVELLGAESAEALVGTPVDEVYARYVVLDEHGGPVEPSRLPGQRALAGEEHPEPLVTRSVDKRTGDERWVLTRSRPLRGPDGSVAYAVNVMEDVSELRRSERESRLLSATSALLSASLDVERTLEQAALAPVPELADLCWVEVPDERGRLQLRAVGPGADDEALVRALREAVAKRPEEEGALAGALVDLRPRLVSPVDDEGARRCARDPAGIDLLRRSAIGSLLGVPLLAGDRAVGLMVLGTRASGRRLADRDVALALEVARRAGIALENARVHDARTQLALTLQRSLLPPRLPVVPGLTIAARFRAASADEAARVGGDFYDLFPSGDGWFVVIGDVTGKGPEAAAITSVARHTMRTAAVYEPSPARVLGRLNDALAADVDRRRLCTALCVRVDPPADDGGPVKVTLACAGHPPPLLLRAGGAPATPVEAAGPLLGAFEEMTWTEQTMPLETGATLVLYTDGVTDARGAGGRFGQARLTELCSTLGDAEADVIAGTIDEALIAFEDGHPQRDDVALLVLRAVEEGTGAGPSATVVAEAGPTPAADLG